MSREIVILELVVVSEAAWADQREAGAFAFGPFPCSKCLVRNGPQRSRARVFCAAKRTLDGEDRSELLAVQGKGPGVSGGVPLAGVRGSAPCTLPRALLARGIKQILARWDTLSPSTVKGSSWAPCSTGDPLLIYFTLASGFPLGAEPSRSFRLSFPLGLVWAGWPCLCRHASIRTLVELAASKLGREFGASCYSVGPGLPSQCRRPRSGLSASTCVCRDRAVTRISAKTKWRGLQT